jgi:hypothetical protein
VEVGVAVDLGVSVGASLPGAGVAVDLGVRVGTSLAGVSRGDIWVVWTLSELRSGWCSSCESGLGLGLVNEDMLGAGRQNFLRFRRQSWNTRFIRVGQLDWTVAKRSAGE